jgi:zinc/manganese transport system substrate-binding protein
MGGTTLSSRRIPGHSRISICIVVLTLLVVSCSSNDGDGSTAGDRLSVVVTTSMLGDVVSNVVGDDAEVTVLFPLDSDPHEYQISSAQASSLQQADLVVANGLLLEGGSIDVLDNAAADGANILEVAPGLEPLPFGLHGGESDEEAPICDPSHPEDGDCDPHVWMDPVRMGDAARDIADALSSLEPDIDWRSRADAYAAELGGADQEIQTILSSVATENRKLVTNHDAFGYFADRYGFEIVGTVIPGGSTLADPSSAELAQLVATIDREGVDAIFAETTAPSALAEAVAAEAGQDVAVVELFGESLTAPGTDADTLIHMLTANAHLIADALS